MSALLIRKSVAVARAMAALAVMLTAAASAADAADQTGELNIGGHTRTYAVHIPDMPPPAHGYPLVLAFHGGGQQGAGIRRLTGLDGYADARGFVVVYPDGLDKHWNDGRSTIKNPQDDVGFVSALIDRLASNDRIDRGRVFATGLSNGALFAERLGCDLSQRIAGIAAVAGTLPSETARKCNPSERIAVLQIDGTADPIMPFNGGSVADFGGRGEGGQVLSVAATAAFWAKHDGCGSPGAEMPLRPVAILDPTRAILMRDQGCPPAAPVNVMTVAGGGHAWPGHGQYAPAFIIGRASRQFDASRAIVDFFLTLPRRE